VIEKKEGLVMLEKAKNRKIFYFFVFIVLGISLFISPVFGLCEESYPLPANTQNYAWSGPDYPYDGHGFLFHNQSEWMNVEVCRIEGYVLATNWNSASFNGMIGNPYTGTAQLRTASSGGGIKVADLDWTFTYVNASYGKILFTLTNFNNTIFNSVTTNKMTYFYSTSGEKITPNRRNRYGLSDLVSHQVDFSLGGSGTVPIASGVVYYSSYDAEKIANITLNLHSGEAPFTVNVSDSSSGFSEVYPYAYYILDFGDGESFTGDWQYSGEWWKHEYDVPGTYVITYNIVDTDDMVYTDSETITVTDTIANYYVHVVGLNTAPIGGANVTLWYNGVLQDYEGSSYSTGKAYFEVPNYRVINGTVTKPGYQIATFSNYIQNFDTWNIVTLYADNETPGSGDSYGNYIVSFRDALTGDSVPYSNIEVYSDSGYTTLFYDEYSNNEGVYIGLLPMNVTYYYKYPETISYYSQSWSYNLTSSQAYKTVNLVPKSGATSTVTPTPTVTDTTITPTVTYTYNTGNLSTLNVKERFTNLLVLAGFQNAESADLIFAMIIVLGCTALIGWITLSGSGAGMGAIIGFVFSLGLGLIPLWLLIAAIFFACLYVALKLFGGSGE
jgi:hypothetical protein